jgi:hypothetical protein
MTTERPNRVYTSIQCYRPRILWLAHSGEELLTADLPAGMAPNIMTRDDEAYPSHILQSFAFQILAETINYPEKF